MQCEIQQGTVAPVEGELTPCAPPRNSGAMPPAMPPRPATTKSERSAEDAEAPMGIATTNVSGRILASIGNLPEGAPIRFETCEDVLTGGVLCALPALLACGLLRHSAKYFNLPQGYYTLSNIFLLLGFMPLNRVNTIESLRRCPPGEWGKVLGLDRCPVVETLREKIKLITANHEVVEKWASELSRDWMEAESLKEATGGLLYLVDGHVRVYHGSQTKLPKHYVARQRLCLRATTDYWVNEPNGTPVFKINQPVDPGMVEVLRRDIIPRLKADIPNQPTQAELDADPTLPRFTIVFDREGYSPALFKELWEKQHIACQTYRKGDYEPWDLDLFQPCQITLKNGQKVTWELAELGVLLGSKPHEQSWVREVRKLSDKGHQTAVISTNFKRSMEEVAASQFGRWSQENFFRYASQSFDLDRLVDYQLGTISDTTEVVNPQWRALDNEVRTRVAKLARKKAEYGAHTLQGGIEPEKVEAFVAKSAALQAVIEADELEVNELKNQRRAQKRKVTLGELPAEERFLPLSQRSKHFVDMIKIVAYRAETAIAQVLSERIHISHRDEARGLARQIFNSSANLRPDEPAGTMTIEIHSLSTPRDNQALEHLCEELNATETLYPGTNLRLIYRKVSKNLP